MKCRFVRDVDVNPDTMPASEREKVQFRHVEMRSRGIARKVLIPYFPKGTVFETQDAYVHVTSGLAEPADEECAKFLGLSEEEIDQLKRKSLKEEFVPVKDWHLFENGVVDVTEKGELIRGPNADKYEAALEAEDDGEDQ